MDSSGPNAACRWRDRRRSRFIETHIAVALLVVLGEYRALIARTQAELNITTAEFNFSACVVPPSRVAGIHDVRPVVCHIHDVLVRMAPPVVGGVKLDQHLRVG